MSAPFNLADYCITYIEQHITDYSDMKGGLNMKRTLVVAFAAILVAICAFNVFADYWCADGSTIDQGGASLWIGNPPGGMDPDDS